MDKHNSKLSFENQDFYIGIDVHKKQWTICISHMNRIIQKNTSIDPSADTLHKFLNRRYPSGNYFAVYEAGFCGFSAARELKRLGIKCIVTHPADVPTKQKERMNKSDRVDAKKLSRSLGNGELESIYIPDEIYEEYRYLARHRYALIKDQTRIKNRLKSSLYYFGINTPYELEGRRWSGKYIKWLCSIQFNTEYAQYAFNDQTQRLIKLRLDLARVLKTMKNMAVQVSSMSPIYKYLLTVPGIGPITAIALLTEIMDINRFKHVDNLVSYIGLSPSLTSSDDQETEHGITCRRNKYLRSMLIEAAWIAASKDPVLTMKFGQLCRRMKKNKAIVHIAKKLVSRIRYVWKNQKPYVTGVIN